MPSNIDKGHVLEIDQLIQETLEDTGFLNFLSEFTDREVRTWSTLEEKALLYGLARHYTPGGVIVELGSYCGGSAAFFAKGLSTKVDRSRDARVICIDPLLGAPPWFSLPPQMFTLQELRANISALNVDQYIDLKIGDSAAVGATWPAEQIDVLLIDGDHSFEGALKDLECWAPKLRDGGIMLFDDIDNIPEMQALDQIIASMSTLIKIGTVGGIGIYQVCLGGAWRLLEELKGLLIKKHVNRPWMFDTVHTQQLSGSFRHTHGWTEQALDIAYDLGYLGVCELGAYGILAGTPRSLCQVVAAIHTDRGGGDLHIINDPHLYGRTFRLVVCLPGDVEKACRLLLPGGLLLSWNNTVLSAEQLRQTLETMRTGGLDGTSHNGGERQLLWGVADIKALSPSRVVEAHMAVRQARAATQGR